MSLETVNPNPDVVAPATEFDAPADPPVTMTMDTSSEPSPEEDQQMPIETSETEPTPPEVPTETDAAAVDSTDSTEPTRVVTVLSELDKYWSAVRDNPGDFTGWTYLLQYVEQENGIENARPAFQEFLARYPYCYGYWKKYADLEKKNENLTECEEVFEKGLQAIPLSLDLWTHYIAAAQEKYDTDLDKETKIRALFERALVAAGTDFHSDKLWESYLHWEQSNKNLKNTTAIYDRVLAMPTQLYSQHFENFCKHVRQNHPREVLTLDEFLKVRQEVVKKKVPAEAIPEDVDADVPGSPAPGTESTPTEQPPGEPTPETEEAAPPGEEKAEDEAPPGLTSSEIEDESEINAIREHIIEARQAVHKLNEQEVSRRWTFEEGIRRPYFHVKPLEKVQIKNWRDYLDFEMEYGAHERIIVLFERCLIACALYEEFWMKYTRYLQDHSTDAVRDVYRRACLIHLKKKPTIHLAWAAFEERLGNPKAAQDVLSALGQEVPKLAMVCLRQISLERRQGHFDKVDEFYRRFIEEAENDKDRTYYAIKFSRYQAKVLRNVTAARETLDAALEKDDANPKLYLQLIDLEYQQADMDESRIVELFQKATNSSMSTEQKQTFSQRRLEFMEDFCSNVTKVQEAYEDHQKLLKELNAQGKKRKAQEAGDDAQVDKKAKTDNGSIANGTSDSSQPAAQQNVDYSQWGYGQQQQWNQNYNNMPYQYNPWGAYSSTYY